MSTVHVLLRRYEEGGSELIGVYTSYDDARSYMLQVMERLQIDDEDEFDIDGCTVDAPPVLLDEEPDCSGLEGWLVAAIEATLLKNGTEPKKLDDLRDELHGIVGLFVDMELAGANYATSELVERRPDAIRRLWADISELANAGDPDEFGRAIAVLIADD